MSRRHAPPTPSRIRARLAGASVALVIAATALLPSSTLAQPGKVAPEAIDNLWQLLEYRDQSGEMVAVPPGIGITIDLFGGQVEGTAACSRYMDSEYTSDDLTITIPPPAIERVECDPASQAVDDAFYEALSAASGKSLAGDILTLYDVTNQPVLSMTAARIPQDPTIARWKLARAGSPDGSIRTVSVGAPQVEFLRGGGSGDQLSGRVVGSTGCGMFLGSYQTNDSSMRITDVDHRFHECTEELKRQAERFVEALGDITDFDVLPAGLTLEDGSGVARLALSPDIVIGERVWTPTEILDARGDVIVDAPERLGTSVVEFFGGRARGSSLCARQFNGNSIQAGLALSTWRLEPEKAGGCKKAPLQIEEAFLEALELSASHALRGDELELLDRDGNPRMRLVPQAELEDRTWVLTHMDIAPQGTRRRRAVKDTGVPITATFTDSGVGVIKGDTGAFLDSDSRINGYTGIYDQLGAARIDISTQRPPNGQACKGAKRRRTRMCRQEQQYLNLLDSATGYVVRKQEDDLRLLAGSKYILWFTPEELIVDAVEE